MQVEGGELTGLVDQDPAQARPGDLVERSGGRRLADRLGEMLGEAPASHRRFAVLVGKVRDRSQRAAHRRNPVLVSRSIDLITMVPASRAGAMAHRVLAGGHGPAVGVATAGSSGST